MERQAPPPGYRLAATPTRAYDCDFRSQLEARWAVFFRCSGIPWQYEPHAVTLPDGRSYLPDFLLWDSVYCEVKPYGNSSEKAKAFAVADPRRIVLLLNGLPDYSMFRVLGLSRDWAGFRSNGEPLLLSRPATEPPPWSAPTWRGTADPNVHCYHYLRARAFAHTCNFKNGVIKIPRHVQKTFAWIEGPQP